MAPAVKEGPAQETASIPWRAEDRVALIWHHGYKGLDAALTAAEQAVGANLPDRVCATLVAEIAADRYQQFKAADVFGRAVILDVWSGRRGQMIRTDSPV